MCDIEDREEVSFAQVLSASSFSTPCTAITSSFSQVYHTNGLFSIYGISLINMEPNAETQLLTDKNESSERNNRDGKSSDDSKDGTRPVQTSTGCTLEFDYVDWKVGKNDVQDVGSDGADSSGEVNMEASITPDDVTRAGGFGARDDMSSFLPVASDFTDFEESILDARDYEEPQGKVCRPGLGWAEAGGSKRE